MPPVDRRRALGRIAAGTAGALAFAPTFAPAVAPKAAVSAPDVESVAGRIRGRRRAEVLTAATALIRGGVDVPTLLGGIFLCGVREIRPRPHGILHSVMMVGSTFQIADRCPAADAWLAALWNLDDLARSMEQDETEAGDWSLPRRPDGRPRAREAARAEMVAAMEAWDPERADQALVALLPHCDRTGLFEVLWPLLARCSAFIGHKVIYAMQVERVLARIGWRYAEPALRSLVSASLVGRDTEAHARSQDLAKAMPARWEQGTEEAAESATLLRGLRTATPAEAQRLVAGAAAAGLGPQTVWDALRLFGSEVFLKRRGRTADTGRLALLPVHALTVVNAFAHAARSVRSEGTRRLLVLQAAAWLAAMRDDLGHLADLSLSGPGLETLGEDGGRAASFQEALDAAAPARVRVHLDTAPEDRERYLAHVHARLLRTGQEHHQHKYAAAMAEEGGHAHPRWASRILAPAVDYLANPRDQETDVFRRARAALREAGILV